MAYINSRALALVNIIVDEVCLVIMNTASVYVRVRCGASMDKN